MFEVLPIDDMECVVVINRKEFCISQCDLKKIKEKLKELEELIKAGAKTITLGKRILRTETASIVVVSNLIYEAEM